MTRWQLILVCVLSAVMANCARAQSPYGSGMPPGMMPGGGPMSMPPGMMPGMMPGGGAPPGMIPQGGGAPLSPDAMMYQGTYPPAAQYRGAIPAPPTVKLPPGVKSENGLLYYNGKAFGEVGYQNPQQSPYQSNGSQGNGYSYYPNQQVAYQEGMPMSQGAPPGGMMPGYGGPAPMGACNGDCNGDCDAGCSDCQDSCWCHGWLFNCMHGLPGKLGYNWTAGADALAMTRSDTGSARPLVLAVDTGATLFNANQWNFNVEAGVRGFVGLTGPSGIQYQAVYMDIPRMGDSALIGSPNNLQIPFPLAADTIDFFGADQMVVRYDSRFQSAEANVIVPWGNFQVLGGYRWVRLHETSVIQAFDFDDGDISDYTANSTNNLNGGQIGILGEWEFFGLLNFDFFAKTGIFCNQSSEHQTLFDFGNTVLIRDTSGSRTDVAYVSELAAQVVVPLGSVFSVTGGYRVLFLNQMAVAPGQFDFTDNADSGTHVNSTSNIVLHGANLGLTAKW